MKKILFASVIGFALLFWAVPALAQGHGGQGHAGGGGGTHVAAPATHASPQPHQQSHQSQPRATGHQHGNTNQARHNGEVRHEENRNFEHRYWDGRRFDHGYFRAYFGRNHCFYPGRPVWFGGYWGFYYSGWQFELGDPWPWYNDPYYIDEDGDVYWIYSPYHPGWRVRVYVVIP